MHVLDPVENLGVLLVKRERGALHALGLVEGAEDAVLRLVDVLGRDVLETRVLGRVLDVDFANGLRFTGLVDEFVKGAVGDGALDAGGDL